MLKRWEKIDLFLVILFLLTIISYFFLNKSIFRLFLWAFIISASFRLIYVIKKKFFWKVRNRLVFSGLFLIVTPLVFIFIFFYIILNIIIAQYGMMIMNNLLREELTQLENNASMCLTQQNLVTYCSSGELEKILQGYCNIVLFENNDGPNTSIAETGTTIKNAIKSASPNALKKIFQYPKDFDLTGLSLEEFSGFFTLKNKLYYGCLKININRMILLCITVNQQFLDKFAAISDFHMKYQYPNKDQSKPVLKDTSDSENSEIGNKSVFSLSWPFKYTYKDFNNVVNSKPAMKSDFFWFFLDFNKIYRKISVVGPDNVQTGFKKIIYLLIFLFGGFIIGSIIIGFHSILAITRSINLISKGTKRIRNGDFSFRIKTRSGDELQDLGESFNEMAAGIDRLLIQEKEKQRLEEELRIARSIQLKLLPPDSFESEEFEIAAVNIPATEIAGDYFDYFYKKNDYFSMLVADVSGKGASAAFYMAELKGVINHLQKTELSPAALITECHNSLYSSFDRFIFITITLAKLIPTQRKIQLARAGHTPAIFYNAREKKCCRLSPDGIAIGLINFSREKIKEIEVNYNKNDILFLFSDGLSEIMNDKGELLGIENLEKIITQYSHLPAEEIKQKLMDFSIQFSETEISADDITFILLKVKDIK